MDQIAGFTKSDGYTKSYTYDAANELKTMMVAEASRRNRHITIAGTPLADSSPARA